MPQSCSFAKLSSERVVLCPMDEVCLITSSVDELSQTFYDTSRMFILKQDAVTLYSRGQEPGCGCGAETEKIPNRGSLAIIIQHICLDSFSAPSKSIFTN